jgi:hypothetical protein
MHRHAPRENGFEAYIAFYLREVFKDAPKLNEVFTFRGDFAQRADLSWQHEMFELVTVVKSEKNQPQVSVVTPSSGPSSNIGLSPHSNTEVLEWISTNSLSYPFCFPPESFGPDILCFLQSKQSGKLLLVLIQAKHYKKVEKQDLIEGVRTVTPAWLWRSKNQNVRSFLHV